MELGTFLLLAVAMAGFSIVLAVALVAAIVVFTGWLIRLFCRWPQR